MSPYETTTQTTAPLTYVRPDLSEIIDEVDGTGAEFVVTNHGRTVVTIVPRDELEGLIETLNILSDEATMRANSCCACRRPAANLAKLRSAFVFLKRS